MLYIFARVRTGGKWMDLELASNIIDIMETVQDAVKQMKCSYESGNISEFNILSIDVQNVLTVLRDIACQEPEEDSIYRLKDGCICALTSLENIKLLMLQKPEEVPWKLECELLAFLEGMYLKFYYYKFAKGNESKKEELYTRVSKTGGFYRLFQDISRRTYSCDLSIYMPAYNHLDYSKLCIESILSNLPQTATCELILLNHGSTDGTKEYFESLSNVHVINLTVNRLFPLIEKRALQGKFSLYVSNDIIIGDNAIENMYRAITEHEDYGWVVPSTSAVSNLQTIPVEYNSLEEFQKFAIQNNIYNETRHEARVRLCNPVTMICTDVYNQLQFDLYEQMFCVQNTSSFPDDKISLWMRRHGLKSILAKDSYCHHFGSITHQSDYTSQQKWEEFYNKGRQAFLKDFDVDPWGIGFCYDYQLFKDWKSKPKDNSVVLGLNCGLGSNSLKIKESLKELGSKNVILYNGIQDKRFYMDAQDISDKAFQFKKMSDIIKQTGRHHFDYILIEGALHGYTPTKYVQEIKNAGITFCELIYKDQTGNWQYYKT